MRIRTVKPEFWRSSSVAALTREDRLLFIGLWQYVDDNGVGLDDHRLIAAALFPLDDDPVEVRDYVRDGLATLSRGLFLIRYEIDGRRYVYIPGFVRHQRVDRPNAPRYPPPPDDHKPPTSTNTNVSRDTRETLARHSPPVVEDKSTKVEEEKKNTPSPEHSTAATDTTSTPPGAPRPDRETRRTRRLDGFDDFWAAYPRKIGKRAAQAAYTAALNRGVEPAELLTGARRYATTTTHTEPRFTAHPATWLNQGRHEDEPDCAPLALVGGAPPQGTSRKRAEAILGLKRGAEG